MREKIMLAFVIRPEAIKMALWGKQFLPLYGIYMNLLPNLSLSDCIGKAHGF